MIHSLTPGTLKYRVAGNNFAGIIGVNGDHTQLMKRSGHSTYKALQGLKKLIHVTDTQLCSVKASTTVQKQ